VFTAIGGCVLLLLSIGGTLAFQFISDRRQATAEAASETESEQAADTQFEQPDLESPAVTESVEPLVPGETTTTSVAPADDTKDLEVPSAGMSLQTPVVTAPPRPLEPANETGLQRIHLPEGYSIALPPGFLASPRAINGMTAIYRLTYPDSTALIFHVTDDRSVTPDTPLPDDLSGRQSTDGKLKVLPLTRADNPSQLETFKLDGMNACFAGMEIDISHPDRTEEINRLYSGAIPAEAKIALADQMRAVTAFQAVFMMKAMDDQKHLEVMMSRTSGQPISPPPEWFNILRTIRHETPPDPARIPPPFVKKR
jgi:hypothetical protein